MGEKTTELVEFIWRVQKEDKRRVSIQLVDVDELSQLNITPELFENLRGFREFQNILNDLDISDEDQLDLFDTLDVDGGGTIDLEELIVGISKLRGDARRSDIIGVSLIVRNIQSAVAQVTETTQKLRDEQTRITRSVRKLTQPVPTVTVDAESEIIN